MANGFIRLRKDNGSSVREGDRMLIAIDAICAIEEQHESHNVSVKTMDGFWYDVVDPIEEIEAKIKANYEICREVKKDTERKADRCRRKRLQPQMCDEGKYADKQKGGGNG